MPTQVKVFIDSNILLYAVDRKDKVRRATARKVLRDLIKSRSGVLSTQVAQEFYVIATKKLGVAPLAAKRVLDNLDGFEIISLDLALIHEAIDCSILSQISFWDALIVVTAKAAGCKKLLSEDLGDAQLIRGVRVHNPFKKDPA